VPIDLTEERDQLADELNSQSGRSNISETPFLCQEYNKSDPSRSCDAEPLVPKAKSQIAAELHMFRSRPLIIVRLRTKPVSAEQS
jgi:hypothetical protein